MPTKLTYKAYTLQPQLTDEQKEAIQHCFAVNRYTWNLFLNLNEYLYLKNLQENHPNDFQKIKSNAAKNKQVNNHYQRQLDFLKTYLNTADNQEIYQLAQPIVQDNLSKLKAKNKDPQKLIEINHLSQFDMEKIFTQFRKNHLNDINSPYHYREVASTVGRCAIKDLDIAYQNFWRNLKNNPSLAGKPHYKSWRYKSCGFIQGVHKQAFGYNNQTKQRFLKIPKIGNVAFHNHRHTPAGQTKSIRIHQLPTGQFRISIMSQQQTSTKLNPNKIKTGDQIGININYSNNVITLSNGKTYTMNWDKLRQIQSRIDYWTKHLAIRKNKYNKQYAILKNRLAKTKQLNQLPRYNPYSVTGVRNAAHARAKKAERLANLRKYWYQQVTGELTRQYKVIFTPKYDVKRLKETTKYGKEKLNLSAIGLFNQQLHTQANKNNCLIIEVDSPYLTQTCHHCGQVDLQTFGTTKHPKRYHKATWTCHNCHHKNQLHVNAALNAITNGQKQLNELTQK